MRNLWKVIRSSNARWSVCRRKFYYGYSLYFLVSVWSPCSFLCKCQLVLNFPKIYICSVVCNWIDTMCSQQGRWRTAFTHTFSQNRSCGETLVHLAKREEFAGEAFLLFPSRFHSAGLNFLQFSLENSVGDISAPYILMECSFKLKIKFVFPTSWVNGRFHKHLSLRIKEHLERHSFT